MEAAYKRRNTGGSRRTAIQTRYSAQKDGTSGDRRRLIQLIVSLALFLLVYIGRGVFPGQLKMWQHIIESDVDFKAAFEDFGQAVSDGESVRIALETLCVSIFGGDTEGIRADSLDPDLVEQLRWVPKDSLSYISGRGILLKTASAITGAEPSGGALIQNGGEEPLDEPESVPAPEVSSVPEPEPSESILPQVVTAVAQVYTDDGVELPSNVSLAYYELGLEKTVSPVMGSITSGFGYRDHPISGKYEFHLALDIGAAEGTEIGAFADGVVEYIGEDDSFGQYLKINHANNVSSFYAHCSKLLVHKGDVVSCGQTVALVGHTGSATGPHLHLTIEKDKIRLDPAYYVDPS